MYIRPIRICGIRSAPLVTRVYFSPYDKTKGEKCSRGTIGELGIISREIKPHVTFKIKNLAAMEIEKYP